MLPHEASWTVKNIRKIFPDSPDATGFRLISKGHVAQAYQDKNILTILSSPGDENFWKKYLDTDTDYGALVASADPEDAYLCAAAAYGRGIRILFQDPWEMIITFIISQQKTIPQIRRPWKTAVTKLRGQAPGL